jgi:hypothetical protein
MNQSERRTNNLPVFLELTGATRAFLHVAEQVDTDEARLSLAFLGPMWLHAHAMCDTLRPRNEGQVMWNLPALSNSARTMIECFVGLAHLAEAKDAHELELRALLWHRQAEFKVADILRGSAEAKDAEIATKLMERVAEIEKKIEVCPAFDKLDLQVRNRLKQKTSRDQYLTSPAIDVWERAGLNRAVYHRIWRTLSQWAHITPLALHLQAGLIDDQQLLVHYTNDAIDTAFLTLKHALTLTVQRSPELDQASVPTAAIFPKFVWQ